MTCTKEVVLAYIKENPNKVRIECDYREEDGNGFCVYHLLDSNKYFYHDVDDDFEEFLPVTPVATLVYSVTNDIQIDAEHLFNMFDNICCGETVYDDFIEYRWYNTIQ